MKKTIWDYFDDNIEFPKNVVSNPIPYGEVWTYISSTFLNGFINYVKPIKCYLIDRYTPDNEDITDKKPQYKKAGTWNWEFFKGTKKELKTAILSGEYEMHHTKLSCFGDDIIILAKIDPMEEDDDGYVFFWFDIDVSDCSIGKFKTKDTQEEVIQSVINFLEKEKEENKSDVVEGFDNGVFNYVELPLSFVSGWVEF